MIGIQKITHHFQKGKMFIGYLTVGDGGIQRSLEAALALIEGGVTLLELGVPFSDPVADGPVIQRASKRALNANTTVQDVLTLSSEIRKYSSIPLILFSYVNPILMACKTDFFQNAAASGIDGILLVDCPPEESLMTHQSCLKHNMAPIYMVTPYTSLERVQQIDHHGQGFLYYACRKGTTGIQDDLPEEAITRLRTLKMHTKLPIVAGFGIASYPSAEKALQYADGVVVGSLFVKAIEDGANFSELTCLARSINPLVRRAT